MAELERLAEGDGEAGARVRRLHAERRPRLRRARHRALVGRRASARAQGVPALRPRGLVEFTGEVLASCRDWLTETFRVRARARPARALGAAHGPRARPGDVRVHDAGDRVALQLGGMPVPRGGGSELVEALAGDRRGRGRRGAHREPRSSGSSSTTTGARGVGSSAARRRGASAPSSATSRRRSSTSGCSTARGAAEQAAAARRFRFGRGEMQIHYALSERPRWQGDERLARTAIVHVTPGLDGVSRAVNEADRGLLPAEATIVVGQPMAVDASRAPDGLVDPLDPAAGAAGGGRRATRRASSTSATARGRRSWRSATPTGSRPASRGTSRTSSRRPSRASSGRPPTWRPRTSNFVGGDIYAGSCALDQNLALAAAPRAARPPHAVARLWHIGASTHPGPGLGAGSGYIVAKELLRPPLARRLARGCPRGRPRVRDLDHRDHDRRRRRSRRTSPPTRRPAPRGSGSGRRSSATTTTRPRAPRATRPVRRRTACRPCRRSSPAADSEGPAGPDERVGGDLRLDPAARRVRAGRACCASPGPVGGDEGEARASSSTGSAASPTPRREAGVRFGLEPIQRAVATSGRSFATDPRDARAPRGGRPTTSASCSTRGTCGTRRPCRRRRARTSTASPASTSPTGATRPRNTSDRVFPGDGVADLPAILRALDGAGSTASTTSRSSATRTRTASGRCRRTRRRRARESFPFPPTRCGSASPPPPAELPRPSPGRAPPPPPRAPPPPPPQRSPPPLGGCPPLGSRSPPPSRCSGAVPLRFLPPPSPLSFFRPPARYGSGGGSWAGASTRLAARSASGVTQAETDVADDLPRNGPERLVLPRLDVAGRPVVDEHGAEDVVGERVHGAPARRAGCRADDEAELELDVEPASTARSAVLGAGWAGGPGPRGPHDGCPGRRRPSRPAVVPDR